MKYDEMSTEQLLYLKNELSAKIAMLNGRQMAYKISKFGA